MDHNMKVLNFVSCVFTVMRRNPFMVDGCCRKGSRNALQELYNPTQVRVCLSALLTQLASFIILYIHTRKFQGTTTECPSVFSLIRPEVRTGGVKDKVHLTCLSEAQREQKT